MTNELPAPAVMGVWYIDIVLAVGAALINLPIREAKIARVTAVAA